ncbi:MAG: hypothetical protein HQM08_11860 [Candidatus Riflebacteria bacterium]|nr:hypothetical protein [Candidatus Riflebacteria bacterium]
METPKSAIESIKDSLKLIPILKLKYKVKANYDGDDPTLFVGVAESNMIEVLRPVVEEYFGPPYKPAGETAFLKNIFDHFVKSVGGVRKEQTLFRKEISPTLILFCAFWPWGSDPVRTSIRIGLIFESQEEEDGISKELAPFFR